MREGGGALAMVGAVIALGGIFLMLRSIRFPACAFRVAWFGFGVLVMFTIIMFGTGTVHP